MRTFLIGALCILLTAASCDAKRRIETRANEHASAAHGLTQRYAASRFAGWHIRATATGSDCSVLVVETSIILEDSMIEAMHYGAGSYDTYKGGVQKFTRDHAFRGVAYKDVSGRFWTYGTVSPSETEQVVTCH